MTTTDVKVLHTRSGAQERAIRGYQAPLICAEAPAGAESLIGKPLQGETLAVDGDYVCLIPIAGLTSVAVQVSATLADATLASSGPDELHDFDPRTVDVANATVRTAGSDEDDALSSGTPNTATLTPTGGIYARYTLTVASAGTADLDIAEVTGL
jgi:hypothetical protein